MPSYNEIIIGCLIDFANNLRSKYSLEIAECENARRKYESDSSPSGIRIYEFNKAEIYGIRKCCTMLDELVSAEINQLTGTTTVDKE